MVGELLDQKLLQRHPLRQGRRAAFVVFRGVVDLQFVGRCTLFVPDIVFERESGTLVRIGLPFLLFEHGVLLHLLFHTLLQLQGGQLQQFNPLDLLWRETLLQFLL